MVVSLAFAAESVAAGYAGEYPLMAALGVLSVCMQVRAYYLAGTVRMPDYSQAQTVEQQQ